MRLKARHLLRSLSRDFSTVQGETAPRETRGTGGRQARIGDMWRTLRDRPEEPRRGLLPAIVLFGILLSACAPASVSSSPPAHPGWPALGAAVGDPELVPVIVSSEAAVGHNRLLITALGGDGQSLAAPDLEVRLRFYDLDADVTAPAQELTASFHVLLDDAEERPVGVYVAVLDFPHAGDWGVEMLASPGGGQERRSRRTFSVSANTTTPALGSAAPPSDTPTAPDLAGVALISSDPEPDPTFYRLSVRDAIAAGIPFVVVFSTPAFCTSRTCGPALELAKSVAPDYAGRVNFVHVEPYELESIDGHLQLRSDTAGSSIVVSAVEEWGIPSEPYVFVVDADGNVAAKFEGPADTTELAAALDAVLP